MVTGIHAAVLLNLHSQVAYAVLSSPLSLCSEQQCWKACRSILFPIINHSMLWQACTAASDRSPSVPVEKPECFKWL